MGLTPLHIRGKRKSPSSKAPNVDVDHPLSSKKMTRSLVSVRASHSSRHRPGLESLPTELLESILLYSANLALPRSSHLIGAKLSGKATLLRLFMMVFHDIWDQWFGIPKLQFQGPAAKKDDVVCEDDVASQSIMLGLPWADIDFILQAQQAWADRYARGRWYEHSVPFADGGEDKSNHDHDGGFSHFNARACFEADYERAIKWPAFQFQDVGWGTQDVHPMAQIPMDLIAGPWNEEKKRRLFWLTRGGIQLHLKMQNLIPWEVKVQCLDNAVISAECPDPLIINCLVSDWTFRDIPEDISRKQVLDLNRRIEWGGDPPDTKEVLRRIAIALNFDMQLPQWLHMPS